MFPLAQIWLETCQKYNINALKYFKLWDAKSSYLEEDYPIASDAKKKLAYTLPRPSLDYDRVSEELTTFRQYTGNK